LAVFFVLKISLKSYHWIKTFASHFQNPIATFYQTHFS